MKNIFRFVYFYPVVLVVVVVLYIFCLLQLEFKFHLGFVVSSICLYYVRGLFGMAHLSQEFAMYCEYIFFLFRFAFVCYRIHIHSVHIFNGSREQCAEDGLRNMFSCLLVHFCRLLLLKGRNKERKKNLFNAAQFDSTL